MTDDPAADLKRHNLRRARELGYATTYWQRSYSRTCFGAALARRRAGDTDVGHGRPLRDSSARQAPRERRETGGRRRSSSTARDGPSDQGDDPEPGPGSGPFSPRYRTADAFLVALDRYWGRDGFRSAPDGVHLAACPVCKSKSLPREKGWLRYPLVVGDDPEDGEWSLIPTCGCATPAIVYTVLAGERDRLDAELAALSSRELSE